MDLTVGVTALPARELIHSGGGESSEAIRVRVVAARERQMARDGRLNARLQGRTLRVAHASSTPRRAACSMRR